MTDSQIKAYVRRKICCALNGAGSPEILQSESIVVGEAAPTGILFGYNPTNGDTFYVDGDGNWQAAGSANQDNIMHVVEVTLTDLGLDETATEEDIKTALATYIEGMVIPEDEIWYFQVEGLPDSGGDLTTYIPRAGTDSDGGGPVTGDIRLTDVYMYSGSDGVRDEPYNGIFSGIAFNDAYIRIGFNPSGRVRDNGHIEFSADGILVNDPVLLRGITGEQDYSNNYDDLTYIQKKYADNQHSYSTTEKVTGGTWIDGKPIYKKTIQQITDSSGGVGFVSDSVDTMITFEHLIIGLGTPAEPSLTGFFDGQSFVEYTPRIFLNNSLTPIIEVSIHAEWNETVKDIFVNNRYRVSGSYEQLYPNIDVTVTLYYTKTTD